MKNRKISMFKIYGKKKQDRLPGEHTRKWPGYVFYA